MQHSATFARHFARLVSLLLHEGGNVDEQKVSLRALVTVNKSGPVTLVAQDWQLLANDEPVPGALTGVQDVASQMAAHSLREIQIDSGSGPADLLGLARIIATRAAPGDGGAQATQKLAALGAKSIAFVVAPVPVPAVAETSSVVSPQSESATETSGAAAAMRAAHKTAAPSTRLMGTDVTLHSPAELFDALGAAKTADGATKALDNLVSLAEQALRVGKPATVADIFHGIVSRDAALTDGELERAYVMTIRRMSKPALLRAVAMLIPKRAERRQDYYEVLVRTGEDGADAVIEQITQAQTAEDRKSLLEVLGELETAVPALIRMLGDSRWFVARNAADLLGEMVAIAAEHALVAVLRHPDDRVRRSATNALLRLGTPDALKGIYEAVNDSSPEVRMQAAAAISTRKDSRTSTTLIRAIEDEEDGDVQLAMIAALGKVATPDAVQKLVKMAEPEGRLFRKKTTSMRVAAVQALGDAKTPAALTALKSLAGDKDRDVRDTAARALVQMGR
jgi:HEAT repeat protein